MTDASAPAVRQNFSFFEPIGVRWAEIDMEGVVFNPKHLVDADTAMTEYRCPIDCPCPGALLPNGADVLAAISAIDVKASTGLTT